MKLELKHLAPYYLHNLRILNTDDNEIYFLTGMSNPYKTVRRDFVRLEIREPLDTRNWSFILNDDTYTKIKLILHPLSDLTKGIEVNGEKLNPVDELFIEYGGGYGNILNFINTFIQSIVDDPLNNSYQIIQKLHEWHFDTQGLIKAGLAIDINTL